MTLTSDDIVLYRTIDERRADKPVIGRFFDGEKELPLVFSGTDGHAVMNAMVAWLEAERERIAKQDATRAYLRSPEMIEKRREALRIARENRKART